MDEGVSDTTGSAGVDFGATFAAQHPTVKSLAVADSTAFGLSAKVKDVMGDYRKSLALANRTAYTGLFSAQVKDTIGEFTKSLALVDPAAFGLGAKVKDVMGDYRKSLALVDPSNFAGLSAAIRDRSMFAPTSSIRSVQSRIVSAAESPEAAALAEALSAQPADLPLGERLLRAATLCRRAAVDAVRALGTAERGIARFNVLNDELVKFAVNMYVIYHVLLAVYHAL